MAEKLGQLLDAFSVSRDVLYWRLLTLRLSLREFREIRALLHPPSDIFAVNHLRNRLVRGEVSAEEYRRLYALIMANRDGLSLQNVLNSRLGRGELSEADYRALQSFMQAMMTDYHPHKYSLDSLNMALAEGKITRETYEERLALIVTSNPKTPGMEALNGRLARGEIERDAYVAVRDAIQLPTTGNLGDLNMMLIQEKIPLAAYRRRRSLLLASNPAESGIGALNLRLSRAEISEQRYHHLTRLMREANASKHPIAYLNNALARDEVTEQRYFHLRAVIGEGVGTPALKALSERLMRGEISETEYGELREMLLKTRSRALEALNQRFASGRLTETKMLNLRGLIERPYNLLSQGIPALNYRLATGELDEDSYHTLWNAFTITDLNHPVLQRLNHMAGEGQITAAEYLHFKALLEPASPMSDALNLLGLAFLNGSMDEARYRHLSALVQPTPNAALELLNVHLVTGAVDETAYHARRALINAYPGQVSLNLALADGSLSTEDYLLNVSGASTHLS